MADFGNAAMRGFQTGFQSQGPSAMGIFVTNLMNRMNKLQEIRTEAGAKVQAEVGVQKELFKSLGQGQGGQGGFVPTKYQVGNVTFENLGQQTQQKYSDTVAARQAEVQDAAKLGLQKISSMRQMLQTDGQRVGNRAALSYSIVPGGFLKEAGQRNLRTELGVTHNMLALKRTGKQGLEQQLPYIQEQYNLGETDPDETILHRLNEMEREFQAALTGEMDDFAILGVSQ